MPSADGFDADLNTRANVTCIPVFSPSTEGTSAVDFSGETALRGFEAALQGLQAKHISCAAVLLCNPHNPSGRCYDREAMLAYGRFVEKHDLHLVVDEVSLRSLPRDAHTPLTLFAHRRSTHCPHTSAARPLDPIRASSARSTSIGSRRPAAIRDACTSSRAAARTGASMASAWAV